MNTSTAGTQNRRISARQLDTRREIWHGPTRCSSNKPSPTDQADARGWPSRQLRHGQTASSVDSSCLARATGTGFRRRASRHVVCVCIGGLAWLQWHALLVPARRVANLARSVGSCALRGPPCYTRALPRCREQRGRDGCRGLVPPRGALAYLALTSCQACSHPARTSCWRCHAPAPSLKASYLIWPRAAAVPVEAREPHQ